MNPDSHDDAVEHSAERAAEARGRAKAQVDARFETNEREIGYIKQALENTRRAQQRLSDQITALNKKFDEHIAVGTALTQQVRESAEQQVSKKTYILGLIGAVIALGMLLLAGIALIHGGTTK